MALRRIGIDARYLSHGLVGGVHTYVRHFVPALVAAAPEVEVVLYADTKHPFELTDLPPRVTVRLLPWRSPLSTIGHDLLLWRELARDRVDLAHFPANYGLGPSGIPTVLTVHDAINLLPLREIVRGHPKRPGTLAKMMYLQAWTKVSVRRAAHILTVSEHARRDIARVGRIEPSGITAIPHAPTPDLRRETDPDVLALVRDRYQLAHPFVLADALKNPATLVRAWRLLPATLRERFRIVFFSRRPDVPAVVVDAQRRDGAAVLIGASRPDLIALYSMAEAFVFPSWIEGFGIPVLEAMTCGAPVIASDRGAIPEVAGPAALLADAEDDAAFARHLERILCDADERRRLQGAGFARAQQFTWEGTARAMLGAFEAAGRAHPSVAAASLAAEPLPQPTFLERA